MSANEPDETRATCTPCRGTGKVLSALGGDPHEETCPWCGGSGRYQPGVDAQDHAPGAKRTDPQ